MVGWGVRGGYASFRLRCSQSCVVPADAACKRVPLVRGLLQGYAVVECSCRSTCCVYCPFTSERGPAGRFFRWGAENVEITSVGCGEEEEGAGGEERWRYWDGETYGWVEYQ